MAEVNEKKSRAQQSALTKMALVLRTCKADMSSHSGFRWPEKGPVECPDWKPIAECGNGLHGLIDGVGDYGLLSDANDAKWLVVEVDRAECVDLGDKVKFPRGNVVYCGDRAGAMTRISKEWIRIAIENAQGGVAVKDGQTAAAQGDSGHAAAQGYRGHAAATGKHGIAIVQGLYGTARAGEFGVILLPYWVEKEQRQRVAVGYVGENGIEPNTAYRVDDAGNFIKV